MTKKNAVLNTFSRKIRQETANTAHHAFQAGVTMDRMAYERRMIHMAKANPPPGWQGPSPSVALFKQNLDDARQAHHNHNRHVRESTEKTNEYVREMVMQSYH